MVALDSIDSCEDDGCKRYGCCVDADWTKAAVYVKYSDVGALVAYDSVEYECGEGE